MIFLQPHCLHGVFEMKLWWNNGGGGATEDFSHGRWWRISLITFCYFCTFHSQRNGEKKLRQIRKIECVKIQWKMKIPYVRLLYHDKHPRKLYFPCRVKAWEYHAKYEPLLCFPSGIYNFVSMYTWATEEKRGGEGMSES